MTKEDEFESPIQAQLAAPPVMVEPEHAERIGTSDSESENFLHSRAVVFGMLFLVTGALGIPLLWMSPNFSNKERVFWAIVVTIYTAILLLIAGAIVMWSYRQIFG